MATARPFAYNSGTTIPGTQQVGSLAIGVPTSGFTNNPQFWNGPDEESGYVIAQSVSGNTQPTPLSGVTASVGFFRTSGFDDNEFINLSEVVSNAYGNPQTFSSATDASIWLTNNGFWNSYITPVLYLDAGNPASYPGTGTVWTDLIGGKQFNLINGPGYDPGNGGKFYFYAPGGQYAICNTSLPSLSTWTVGVWHYYDGTETGSAPCIVTETFIGGSINYSLGNNTGPFSTGFFDGGWRVTDGYSLTPNNWYYIVGTYDGSTVKLYVNNTLVDSTPYVGTPTTSGAGIRLMERWDLSDYWGGYLSTVAIYDKALNQSQITTNWNDTKSRFGYGPTPTPTPTGTPVAATPTPTTTPTNTPTPSSTSIPVTGYAFNLVATPYNFPSSGNSIMNNTGGLNTGSTEINVLATGGRGFYFNSFDTDGIDRTSYYSTFTGQSVTITFSQSGNTAIYSGDTNSFKEWIQSPTGSGFVFGANIGVPPSGTPSGAAVLIQSATTNYTIGIPVYVSLVVN
jgi:hypothetical protein